MSVFWISYFSVYRWHRQALVEISLLGRKIGIKS